MCGCLNKSYQAELSLLLLVTHCKVVRTFESKGEILKFGHSNKATEQLFLVMLFIMLDKVAL